MLEKFKKHIDKNMPQLKGKKLLLAISGGVDSIVLFHLFVNLHIDFVVAHMNFSLRKEQSDADENFVMKIAQNHNKKIITKKVDTLDFASKNKLSIQEAARNLRYEWFYSLLNEENLDMIATAHHLDDQVETFFINLSRGTGIEGLLGIPEVNNKILRPLLPFSKNEIREYALQAKLTWREDESNEEDYYLRNKIRHHLVPLFKELNVNFLKSFKNTIFYLQQANSIILDASREKYKEVVTYNDDVILIDISKLIVIPNYPAYLYQWLCKYGFTAWNDINKLVFAQSGKKIESKNYILLKDRSHLILYNKTENNDEIYIIEKDKDSISFPIKLRFNKVTDLNLTNKYSIYIDTNLVKYPLHVRRWKEGDYFYPSGMNGKKKISKFFKDEKISIFDKNKIWLLCNADDSILWIIGKRQDQRFMAKNNSQTNLEITWLNEK